MSVAGTISGVGDPAAPSALRAGADFGDAACCRMGVDATWKVAAGPLWVSLPSMDEGMEAVRGCCAAWRALKDWTDLADISRSIGPMVFRISLSSAAAAMGALPLEVDLAGLPTVAAHWERGGEARTDTPASGEVDGNVPFSASASVCVPVGSSNRGPCSVVTRLTAPRGLDGVGIGSCESGISGEFKISRPNRGLLERGREEWETLGVTSTGLGSSISSTCGEDLGERIGFRGGGVNNSPVFLSMNSPGFRPHVCLPLMMSPLMKAS